ncbi:hypothetical protein OCS_02615 [Ophiocordyceps sinensis CO18]|uniref:Uncharacterized protein n=1 Tax=Ophiocordyceps sinensis (strain Co18 / CGMCC 3.14243) TaxID=911162 RepID=T5A893_OPHSC|nr:hypothetical protein OCS_02615 [Ophiocordyceps sinensis CO18]
MSVTIIDEEGSSTSPALTSPREGEGDVADRAAALLQGMRRGDERDGDDLDKRESLRKARRQTAEEERRLRRRRREKATASQLANTVEESGPAGDGVPTPTTDTAHSEDEAAAADEEPEKTPSEQPESRIQAE